MVQVGIDWSMRLDVKEGCCGSGPLLEGSCMCFLSHIYELIAAYLVGELI
jgi:hypothetical protein